MNYEKAVVDRYRTLFTTLVVLNRLYYNSPIPLPVTLLSRPPLLNPLQQTLLIDYTSHLNT